MQCYMYVVATILYLHNFFSLSFQKLHDFYVWVDSWIFIGARRPPPVQRGWLLAISSLQAIARECVYGLRFKYLLTGRFNQDCVEV